MGFSIGDLKMNERQAKALGAMIRERRQALGYSTYQLAEAAGVPNSTVVRIELGRFAAPSPDKLSKFAASLSMGLGEVFAMAGYVVPDELPELDTYLKIKYPRLSKSARKQLGTRLAESLATDSTRRSSQ